MKIFLFGNWKSNCGPSNVIRELITHSDEDLLYIKNEKKFLKSFEILYKIIRADVIVFSGSIPKKLIGIIKFFKKKTIHLMHGCLEYENEINNLGLDKADIENEKKSLEMCNRIVCVSENYSKWVKNRYPEYENKILYVNNGVEISPRVARENIPYSIALTGGNREIKKNKEVCLAVQRLIAKGIPCQVYIFGRLYEDNCDLTQFSFVEMMGHLDKEEYYEKLDKIQLLIMNSETESFGLVAADALNCNCSLLMSSNVGAQSIMQVKTEDIIMDPNNIEDIVNKIEYIFNNNNNERLVQSIDVQDSSCESSYLKLKNICKDVCNE